MYLVKIKNNIVEKFPYSVFELRQDNPNVSFPGNLTAEVLSQWGVFAVSETLKPEYDVSTQDCIQINPIFNGTAWVQQWQVVSIDPNVQQKKYSIQSEKIRTKRDRLLSTSDWTQLADAPLDTQAWAAYRQALRDVPQQAGFPWDVTWPTKP